MTLWGRIDVFSVILLNLERKFLKRVNNLTKKAKASSKGILSIIITPINSPVTRNKTAPGDDRKARLPCHSCEPNLPPRESPERAAKITKLPIKTWGSAREDLILVSMRPPTMNGKGKKKVVRMPNWLVSRE